MQLQPLPLRILYVILDKISTDIHLRIMTDLLIVEKKSSRASDLHRVTGGQEISVQDVTKVEVGVVVVVVVVAGMDMEVGGVIEATTEVMIEDLMTATEDHPEIKIDVIEKQRRSKILTGEVLYT